MGEAIIENLVKYWVAYACGILGGLLTYLWHRVTKIKRQSIGMHNGLLALLRDRINQACRHYLGAGFISMRDREVLNAMFESYFDMGGNGAVKHLKGEIDALPTRIDEIH